MKGEVILDMSSYNRRAEDLYRAHEEEIQRDSNEGQVHNERDIGFVLRGVSDDVLRRYAGHGVTRDATEGNIAAALSLLENNIIIGDIAPLKTAGHLAAYTSGDFLVISRRGGFTGPEGRAVEPLVVNINGRQVHGKKVTVGALVCNLSTDSLVEALRSQFPGSTVLHSSELVDYIQEQERRAVGT